MLPAMQNFRDPGKLLPQVYPFLLLDEIAEFKKGERLIGVKNITANEWPFTQIQPGSDHYPETLLIEAAAQAALVFYRANL